MSHSFNLTTEPWIPCVMADGTLEEVSLHRALTQAHEIREVVDASPLVTCSLHRLLIAILHRVVKGPASADDWGELWEAGRFDTDAITDYFDKWRHRFDLFDEERPFYQRLGMPESIKKGPPSVLAPELAAQHNPTLFDHSIDEPPDALDPATAARLVVYVQNYRWSGTHSGENDISRHPKAGSLRKGATVLFTGVNVFQTLLLNLAKYSPHNGGPPGVPHTEEDAPAWEQPEPALAQQRMPYGYLDYLTWQCRRIWLKPVKAESGDLRVTRVVLSGGLKLAEDIRDPMMPYGEAGGTPKPVKLTEKRAVWRDSTALFRSDPGTELRSYTADWIAELGNSNVLHDRDVRALCVFGLTTEFGKAAKTRIWRHERFPMPLVYLRDNNMAVHLGQALDVAERVAGSLRKRLKKLAAIVAAPDPEREADSKTVQRMMERFPALPLYWSSLGEEFEKLILDLPGDDDHCNRIKAQWATECVEPAALQAFKHTADGLPRQPRFLRAIVQTEKDLFDAIHFGITKEFREVNYAETV